MYRGRKSSNTEWLIASLGALAAGFALALLYKSPRGRKVRLRLTEEASRGVHWLDHQLEEAKKKIIEAGDEAAEHIRAVVEDTVEKVIPDFGDDDAWNDVYTETEAEVRRAKQ